MTSTASPVDLRSDTVTRPTARMRDAMARAEVGDDVYGEDPTVNRLQELAADLLGMEAALFVASGTMGNLASLLAHCGRGDEVIVGDESHIYHYEQGGASALGGMVFRVLATDIDGRLSATDVEQAIRSRPPGDPHSAVPGVVCLENTHNRRGGLALDASELARVKAVADRHGLPVHLDGARLPNAAVALGVPMRDLAAHATSVQLDLSKGLGAPVGGLVAGPTEFIARVHRARKVLGGGMRQAGVLAAAGIVALTEMVDRMAEDHARARRLSSALAELPGIVHDPSRVQTNIITFRLGEEAALDDATFLRTLADRGVLAGGFGGGVLRLVTHVDVDDEGVDRALEAIAGVLGAAS